MTSTKERMIGVVGFLGAISLLMCACGGGGGGGGGVVVPATYSGITTQAVLTSDNAQAIVLGAWDGGRLPGDVFDAVPLSHISAYSGSDAGWLDLAGQLKNLALKTIPTPQQVLPLVLIIDEPLIPDCGGTGTAMITVDEATGTFSGPLNFVDFCTFGEGGVETIWNGTMRIEGRLNVSDLSLIFLTMRFIDLNIADNSMDVALTEGHLTFTPTPGGTGETLSGNYVLRDNVTLDTFWINNYVIRVTYGLPNDTATLTGRYYDSDYGFVDITNPTLLTVPDTIRPTGGALLFTGLNSKARLTFNPDMSGLLELDANNDGIFETDLGNLFAID